MASFSNSTFGDIGGHKFDRLPTKYSHINTVYDDLEYILVAPRYYAFDYGRDLNHKRKATELFNEIQRSFKDIKCKYDAYIAKFNENVDKSLESSRPIHPLKCIDESKIKPKTKIQSAPLIKNASDEKYKVKINGKTLIGGIGGINPKYDRYKLQYCNFKSIHLCRRVECPFYHDEEQRNFNKDSWGKLINNKNNMDNKIKIFLREPYKTRKKIIDDHMAFTMHNLLITLTLMDYCVI